MLLLHNIKHNNTVNVKETNLTSTNTNQHNRCQLNNRESQIFIILDAESSFQKQDKYVLLMSLCFPNFHIDILGLILFAVILFITYNFIFPFASLTLAALAWCGGFSFAWQF